MGNQVGSVSSAEVNNKYNQCLQDLTEYELQTKLKETAFFKVVRSRHSEGDVVLKVYIPPNSSVPIKEYLDRIDAQKRVFPNPTNANVLPYQRCHYSERYACLVRQFVKYSLYDRMDTRPFLLDVEKRWIAFQLLCAIATLNKVSLCHGDIKSENVLLTSWGWVLLTDFAPFKPVFLPDDNPADYSFYFDISGRRTCYIAPERFYHANRSSAYGKAAAASASGVASTAAVEPDADFGLSQKQQNVKRGQLEHSMDVFSAGCVLLELFSEDSNSQPFDLSQLLAFKKDQYTPTKLILRLADENIRSHIAKFLILDSDKKSERNVGLVIILNLLTSSVRHVRFAQSKLDGLKCLEKLACHLPDHIVLDRILPYILDMMTDSSSRVRSGAILSLANTVGRIDTVGYKYVNLFADYIFPTVEHLSRDVSVQVRSSLAEILGRLADTAKKFLDSVREQSMAAWLPPMEGQNATTTALSQQEAQHLRAINFEAELQSLRRTVSVRALLRRAPPMHVLRPAREASDHVMSHAITFLNEGPDLRWSFYEQLYCMVAFIGDHGAEMLVPLLEQGLADPDPAVLVAALICLRSLVADRSSDVGRRFGAPLCAKSLPLLSHPDVFVRHAAAGLLCATAGRLGPAEFHCRLVAPDSPNSPRVQRHLANEVLVLSALGPPVPPAAWRCLATTPRHLVERLFVALEERRHVRLRCQTAGAGNIQDSAGGSGDESALAADGPQQPCYARLEEDAAALLAKLGHLGLEESMEDRLLALRDLALKQTTASSAAALSTPSVSSAAVDYIGVERLKLSDLATVTSSSRCCPGICLCQPRDGLGVECRRCVGLGWPACGIIAWPRWVQLFVRHAAAGLLCATAGRLGPAEFHCRLVAPDSPNSPRVSDHLPAAAKRLAGSQRHLANEVLVLSALGPPVPPAAWRCLATTPRHLVERLFVALEERRHVRLRCQTAGAGNIQDSAGGSGDESGAAADGPQQPCYARLEEDAAALLAKLGHLGLEGIHGGSPPHCQRLSSAAVDYIGVERLKLSDLATVTEQQSVLPRHLSLSATGVTVSASNVVAASVLAGQPAASSLASMGAAAPAASLGATAASDFASGSSVAVAGSSPSAGGGAPAGSQPLPPLVLSCRSLRPVRTCRTDLDNLLARRRAEYGLLNSIVSSVSYSNSSAGGSLASAAFPGCDTWTPKGVLVNHISEHRGRINSLSVSADHRAFATASDDATVRLWDLSDCHKNPDQCVSGKSKLTYADFPSRVLGAYWQRRAPTSCAPPPGSCVGAGRPPPHPLRCRAAGRHHLLESGARLSQLFPGGHCTWRLLTWMSGTVRTQDFVARYDVDPVAITV
uniref:non-specific serine/threonine protein kinase n=1 Tax=Macrostomum lignano TaxID=282301 RepID=A0A1I8J823_9PLAT